MLPTRGVLAEVGQEMPLLGSLGVSWFLANLLALAWRLEPLRGWCKQLMLPTRGVLAEVGQEVPLLGSEGVS